MLGALTWFVLTEQSKKDDRLDFLQNSTQSRLTALGNELADSLQMVTDLKQIYVRERDEFQAEIYGSTPDVRSTSTFALDRRLYKQKEGSTHGCYVAVV